MQLYSSAYSYEESVVIPALGEDAGDYDTLAIAQEMLEWVAVPADDEGWDSANQSGMAEREDVDCWEVATKHYNGGISQLQQITALDEEITTVEEQLADLKARRDAMAKAAVDSGVPLYRIAQATGRTRSTVQRWVK
mgnify:CR=1 FL=1